MRTSPMHLPTKRSAFFSAMSLTGGSSSVQVGRQTFLELVVLITAESDELVIYAMRMRPKYERFLSDD